MRLKLVIFLMGILPIAANSRDLGSFDFEFCRARSDVATQIMTARQLGRSMADLMDRVNDPTLQASVDARRRNQVLVERAFAVPRYSTSANQSRAAQDFANETYRACIQDARSEK